MASNPIVLAVLVLGVGGGAFIDLRTRRVPNALTMTLAAIGIACAAGGLSGLTVVASVLGLALGLGLMLPGYMFGATGAGDVKLLAAAGALLGPAHIGLAFLYTALAGGILALLVARSRRRLALTLEGTGRLIATRAANAAAIEHPAANNRFAYAPAIAVGCVLAAFGL
ncbi:MAG TPA: prepilin peptidase [Vicinamibacterales bacterium]|nr:prepilin peptidase [Vicinamibacterales bacterium]